jgi:hypothetical protein
MLPDYASLAEAVRAWAQAAGVQVDLVSLSYHERQVLVLPLTNAASPPGNGNGEEKGKGISPVVADVLRVLRAAGTPLTGTRIMEEMARAGIEWSKRSVDGYLAEMVADGTLENPDGARPRGYRLPAPE